MALVPLKITFNNATRRVAIPGNSSLLDLWRLVARLYAPVPVSYQTHTVVYEDDEEELVEVFSDEELHEAYRLALRANQPFKFQLRPRRVQNFAAPVQHHPFAARAAPQSGFVVPGAGFVPVNAPRAQFCNPGAGCCQVQPPHPAELQQQLCARHEVIQRLIAQRRLAEIAAARREIAERQAAQQRLALQQAQLRQLFAQRFGHPTASQSGATAPTKAAEESDEGPKLTLGDLFQRLFKAQEQEGEPQYSDESDDDESAEECDEEESQPRRLRVDGYGRLRLVINDDDSEEESDDEEDSDEPSKPSVESKVTEPAAPVAAESTTAQDGTVEEVNAADFESKTEPPATDSESKPASADLDAPEPAAEEPKVPIQVPAPTVVALEPVVEEPKAAAVATPVVEEPKAADEPAVAPTNTDGVARISLALKALEAMGFIDRRQNLEALVQTRADVPAAVQILLGQPRTN